MGRVHVYVASVAPHLRSPQGSAPSWAQVRRAGAGQQAAPPQAEPTFRTDASFVLTDVFVTADGKPVTDLTAADFEVKEDGVVQTIRSFESVVHKLQPVGLPRRNPSTVAESNAMIGDPRRRVYVVFLDTYHVDRGSAMYVRKALQDFFGTAFGPDDLVAYMTPHMTGRDISFSTSTEPLIASSRTTPPGVSPTSLPEMRATRSSGISRPASVTPRSSARPGWGCAPGCASRNRSRPCAAWSSTSTATANRARR